MAADQVRSMDYIFLAAAKNEKSGNMFQHIYHQGLKDSRLELDKGKKNQDITYHVTQTSDPGNKGSVSARLIIRVYETDPIVYTKCVCKMKTVAVIMDPIEVKKILRHLVKIGTSPPGINGDALNIVLLFYLRC